MADFDRAQLSVSIARVNSARAYRKSTGASFSSVLKTPAALGLLLSGTATAVDHDIQAVSDFTSVSSNNNTHDITSKKMSGTSAINVFNKFVVGSSHTVNLQVPDNASKLVNIVRGSEAPAVHGIMNSYQNGSLGGDVVFASSAGFLVGASGVVNVGSLAIKTPTEAEITGLTSGADVLDSKINDLINDSFSVSSSGAVRIKGKINTASGLNINANTIQADSGSIVISGRAAEASVVALSAVNVDDLTIPTELNVDGGVITLKASSSAAGAIDLSGDLYADGGFTIMAENIDIKTGATLDSRDSNSASAAGSIAFRGKRDQTTTTLNLSASGKTVLFDSGTPSSPVQSAEGITVIGNTTVAGSATVSADTFKTKANSSLDISGSLLVTADSQADVSGTLAAESGITITSKNIDLNAGSLLDTRNSNDSSRGDVTLTASVTTNIGIGEATADTNIDLGGQIYADNLTAKAKSIASSSFYEEPGLAIGQVSGGALAGASFYLMDADADATVNVNSSANIQASGNVSLTTESHALTEASSITLGNLLPAALAAVYATSDATSTTHVKSGATIQAEGDLEVSAHNESYISASAMDVIAEDSNKVVIAAAVGESDVDATAKIDSGVTLDADNLVLAAENQNYYYVSASAYGFKNTQYGVAVAVGDFDTNTTAELGSSLGTDNDKSGNVTITSLNRTLNQRVHSGVTVGSSLLFRTVGSKAVQGLSALQTGVTSYTNKYLPTGQSVEKDESGKVSFKGGLAFSLNLSDHEAYGYLGTNTSGQADAPKIKATGNVLLASQVDLGTDNEKMAGGYGTGSLGGDQGGYRTSAETAVTAPKEGSTGAGQTSASDTSLAMALNFAINDSDAVSEIGDSVQIDAANLGVVAGQYMPIVSTYDKWDTIADVLGKFNGIGGLQNNLLTTFANAGASADKEAYGGSLNIVVNDMDTKAWVNDNAKVTTTGTGSWSANREVKANSRVKTLLSDYRVFSDINYNFNFDHSVEVSAYNLMETANLAGNIGALGLLPNGNGTNKKGKAVGASVTYVQQSGEVVAGIGQATVTAAGGVDIYAETDERHVLVTPSSGMGKGLGFNGVLGFLNSEVLTHASLHNSAQFSASDLVIIAGHEFGNWSAAGAVNWSDESAVGIAIAANVSQGDTKAFIGDNSSDYNYVKFEDNSNSSIDKPDPTAPTAPTPTKGIVASTVTVRGRSSGTNGSIAVAGALTTEPSNEPGVGAKFESWYNGLSSKVAANYTGANSSNGDSSIGQSANSGSNDNSNSGSGQSSAEVSSAQTGLTGAGSFTVSVNNMDAKAIIDGASISGHSNGNGYNDVDVEVQALEKVISASASGSAALSMLGMQSPSNQNTIAGAIAYQISFNDALAWIKNSTINYAGDVAVLALHGGELTSVALALSITRPAGNSQMTRNGALSISGAQIYDGTSARIEGSSISANSGTDNDLEVSAYNNSYVGVGGGTLYGGGKQGAGLAITFAEINDPSAIIGNANPDDNNHFSPTKGEDVYNGAATEAIIDFSGSTRSTINNFDQIDVSARSLNRIGIGAAGVGYNANQQDSLGFQGSFAIGSIGADTKALVKGVDISGATTVNVNATGEKDGDLDSIISNLGSSDTNKDFDFSGAEAMDNTNVHTSEDGSGSTYSYNSEGKRIIAVAGVVQAGKKNLGISYAHADVKSETKARIVDTNINKDNSSGATVNVNARDNSLLYSVAIGVGVGTGGFSGVGSVAVNRLNNQILAEIGDWDGNDKGTINATDVAVTAQNDMDMINVAGSVAVASGQNAATAGGLAVALNLVGTDEHSTRARVSNTSLKVDDDLTVKAYSGTSSDHNLLVGNAIAIGANLGQSGLAFAGAIGVNNVDQTIEAGIKDIATNRTAAASSNSGGDILVKGQDYTDSVATAWMGAGSGQGSAFGVATATNRVDSDVTAEILGDNTTAGSTYLKAQNVTVDAHRRNWLLTIDAGVAASKQVSFAPSVGTGIIDGNVTARIAQDAKVEAWNNVVVEASARSVNLVGSGALGIGVDGGAGALAVSTAIEYGKTEAYVDDAVIVAKGLGSDYSASSGQLNSNSALPDLSTAGEGSNDSVDIGDLTTGFASHSMQEGTESASGLVVSATSYQKQRAITVGGAGSKNVALTANVSTTSVDSSTSAYINNSTVNQGYTPTSESDVLVRGSNHSFGLSVAAGGSVTIGGESGLAAIGGFSTNRDSKDTTAKIENSTVNANEVEIDARASRVAQAVSAGVAAALGSTSGIGGAASVVITEQNGDTTAWLRGGTVTSDGLAVNAETRQEANVAAGAAGIGTTVGVGVGLAVNLVGGDTRARIGKDDGNSNDNITTVVNSNDVDVKASRLESLESYAFGAGIGASSTGVAAMVNTTEITGETRAGIYGKYHNSDWTTKVRGKDGSSKATTVDVSSQEILNVRQAAAGLGVGASVGVGAVANVLLGRSQTYSEMVGSAVKGSTINVKADTLREAELVSVSGAGGQYSAAISLGLILMGQGDSTTDDGVNAEDEFGDSRDMANNALAVDYDSSNPHLDSTDTNNMGGGSNIAQGGSSSSSNAAYTNYGSRLKLTGESVTAARISGGDIDTSTLTVNSDARLYTYQGVGAAQGSAVGVAGGIGITRLYDMSIATADADITADNITIGALTRNKSDDKAAGEMKNFVIGVGGTAIGVSYSDVRSRHRVVAGLTQALSSDTVNDAGTLVVSAKDTTEIRIGDTGSDVSSNPGDGTMNIQVGAGAVGVSVGIAEKDSDVDAWLGAYDDNGTSITSDDKHTTIDGFSSQSLTAEVSGMVRSTAFAAAGGLLGGVQGVVTDARDRSNVDAVVYGQIGTGSGTLNVKAIAVPETFSRAYGVTVAGGASLGGSFSYATADTAANATIADRTRLSENGTVNLEAITGRATDDQYVSADASAFSASGALLVGISGSEAVADNTSDTTARVGDYVQLPTGDLNVSAINRSRQISDADGYFVGYYSAGLTFSTAKSQTSTRVFLGKDPIGPGSREGDIILLANSIDENQGFATAGGGGVVSGSATVANARTRDTADKASASVQVADWSSGYTSSQVGAGKVQMEANHQTLFFAGADSVNASVLGGSGARSDVEVDLDTAVKLGQNVSFHANEIDFSTSNNLDQISSPWQNSFNNSVKSGAGGVLNGSAALSDVRVSHLGATVDVGNNAVLKIDPLADALDPEHSQGDYHIQMDAFTTWNINDSVVLTVGGAFQGAGTESSVDLDAVNTVKLGDGVQLLNPVGQVEIGTYSRGFASADASTSVYAPVGVAGGVSDVDVTTDNVITLGDNVVIDSFESTKILAGRSADYLTENYLSGVARTNIFNSSGLAISAEMSAKADVTVNSIVTFGDGVDVSSVRDILLESDQGHLYAEGDGYEKKKWLGLFSETDTFGSGNTHGGGTIIFDGSSTLEAGSRYQQSVTVNADGSITLGTGTEAVAYNYGSFSSRASLQQYINDLKAEKTALENQTGGITDNQGGFNDGGENVNGGDDGSHSDPVVAVDDTFDSPARIAQIDEELAFLEPLLDTLPKTSNDAVYIGGLYAAGGDVNLKADTVEVKSGTPTITAHGDPTITITNTSRKSLILGDMFIPNVGGGSVLVTGSVAGNLPAGLTINESNNGSGSHINVQHKPSVTSGADVVLQGNLINLGGIVTVNVEKGNLIQTGSVAAKQMALSVPTGIYLLNNSWQDQTYGFNPESLTGFTSQWKPATPDELVMYYVNARYGSEMTSRGEESFNEWWYGNDYYGNNQERDGTLRVYLNWGFNNGAECKSGADCERFLFDGNSDSRGNGDWGFNQIKNLQSNLVKTATYEQVKAAGFGDRGGYALEAQLVAVNAYRIDINGTIRAGNFNEWSVEVGNNFDAAIAAYAKAKGLSSGSIIKLSPGQTLSWQEANPNYGKNFDFRRYITKTADPQVSLVNGGDAGISIAYEVGSGKITLDDVNASGNGFVSLRGRIMSTGKDGKVLVDDGRGSIDVINRSTSELVINDMNAGSQSTGVIRITDLNYRDGDGDRFSEWYVHEPGQSIQQYVTKADATSYANAQASTVGGLVNGKQTYTYQPKEGQLYYFVQNEEVERTITWKMDGEYISGWFSTYQPLSNWQYDTDNPTKAEWNIAYDGYATCQTVSVVTCGGDGTVSTYLTHVLDDRYKNETWLYPYTTSYSKYYGSDFTKIKWNIHVPYYVAMKSTTYVKADNPIKFQFIGADTGSINIQSRADVTLAGNINNSVGTTRVSINRGLGNKGSVTDSGNILMSNTGILNSQKTYLDSAGALGSSTQSLTLITDHISAIARNGAVNIDMTAASGDISVEALQATSNLNVRVDKGLTPYGNGLHLKGDDINITSDFGGIGDVSANKVMNLSSTGLVTMKATGDIALNQSTGNLKVKTIESEAGDVWITLGNGHLENGIGQERYTDEELAYQATVWDRLNLKSDDAGAEAVNAYENQVSSQYHQYWMIKQRLTDDAGFTIDPDYVDAFKVRYKARQDALNGTNRDLAGITLDEVTADLKTEFDALSQWLSKEKNDGNLAADFSFGNRYDSSYRFAIADNSALHNKLTDGARWSDTQLEIAISSAALEPVTDGYITSRDANISGNNIRLNINQGRVGEDLADMIFDISRSNPNLSSTEKVALLEAGPGDLQITDKGNSIGVRVKQQDPVKINGDGDVTLMAGQQIYVESDQGMTLRKVSTSGDVRLATNGAIESASGNATTIAADNLNLSTGSGHIGTEQAPIRLDLEGALRSVASPSNVWLSHVGGNLQVGAIGAGGLLNLTANGHIRNWSANNDNVHIIANGAVITAKSGSARYNIGEADRALNLRLSGGSLELKGGNARIQANSSSLVDIAAVDLTGTLDFDSASRVDLSGNLVTGALDMDVEERITARESLNLTSSGNLNMVANILDLQKATVSGSSVYLEADSGAATLGPVTSTSGTMALLASGDMNLHGQIDAKQALTLSAQSLTMNTGSSIAARSTANLTTISDMALKAITTSGNLRLKGDNISVNADITGNGSAAFDIDADRLFKVVAGNTVGAGGNLDLDAGSIEMLDNSHLSSGSALTADTLSGAMTLANTSGNTVAFDSNGDLISNGQIDSGSTAALTSKGTTRLNASAVAVNDFSITSVGDITLSGPLTSEQGSIILRGQKDLFVNRRLDAFREVDVDVARTLSLDVAKEWESTGENILISSAGKTTLKASSILMSENSLLDIEGDLELATSGDQVLARLDVEGNLDADSSTGSIRFNERADMGMAADIVAAGNVTVTEQQTLSTGRGLKIQSGALGLLAGSTLATGTTLNLINNTMSMSDSSVLKAAQDIQTQTSGRATFHQIESRESVNLSAGDALVVNSTIDAGSALTIDANGTLTLHEAVATKDNIAIDAVGVATMNERLTSAEGAFMFRGDSNLTINNTVSTKGNFTVTDAQAVSLATGKDIVSDSAVAINAASIQMGAGSKLGALSALTLTTTGNQKLATLEAGDDLKVESSTGWVAFDETVSTQGEADIDASGSLALADNQGFNAKLGTDINANSVNFGDHSIVNVDGSLNLSTAGKAELYTIDVEGGATLTSGGNLVINDRLDVVDNLTLDVGGDATFNGAVLVENALLADDIDGKLTVNDTLTVEDDINITVGKDAEFNGVLTSNSGLLDIQGSGALTFNDDVSVNDSINLVITSGVSLAGGKTITSVGNTAIQSASVTMGDTAHFDIGVDLTIDTSGNQELATLNVGGSLDVDSSVGAVDFKEHVSVLGNTDLLVENAITLADDQKIESTGWIRAESDTFTMGDRSIIKSGESTSLFTDGDQQLATLDIGDDFTATSQQGAIHFNESVTVANDMNLLAAGEITLAARQAINAGSMVIGSETLPGADSFSMGEDAVIHSHERILVHTRGDQRIGQLVSDAADSTFYLKTTEGSINGRSDLDIAGGERHLKATQRVGCDIDGESCTGARGHLMAATGIGDPLVIDLPWLSAETDHGDINILASSDLHARLLRATNGNIYMTALGYLALEELVGTPWLLVNDFLFADRMTLDKGGLASRERVAVNQLDMSDSGPLAVYAPEIDLTINGGGATETEMAMGGFNKTLSLTSDARSYYQNLEAAAFQPDSFADDVRVDINDTDLLNITGLLTQGGDLRMTGKLLMDAATVNAGAGYNFRLVTGYQGPDELTLNLNNSDGSGLPVDGQFMTPYGEFWMSVDDITVTTNAQFTRYNLPLLLSYKSSQNALSTIGLPESFYRLSLEYQNEITDQTVQQVTRSDQVIDQLVEGNDPVSLSDGWLAANMSPDQGGSENPDGELQLEAEQSEEEEAFWLITEPGIEKES